MKPVAVVSCHVECMLDDRVWRRYAALAGSRPGGFRIAALMRPPDGAEWRESERWVERAREAAEWGPVGLHTHFGGRESARPGDQPPAPPADRVSQEAAWLAEQGIEPRFFCGGGWYMDADVASVLAGLDLTDSTATRFRHGYLPPGAPRLSLDAPATIEVGGPRPLNEVPSTHSVGLLWRDMPRGRLPDFVHFYFHDSDLTDPRRRAAIWTGLRLLRRFRAPADLASAAIWERERPRALLPWAAVAAG